MRRGFIVAAIHVAIVFAIAGKYAWDRDHLPRAWAKSASFDPNLPVRGRYVNLNVVVPAVPPPAPNSYYGARVLLSIVDGQLTATLTESTTEGRSVWARNGQWQLANPVAFFLPEHVDDPTRLKPGEELWVELSIPPKGGPRPIRLALKKDGVLAPLSFR